MVNEKELLELMERVEMDHKQCYVALQLISDAPAAERPRLLAMFLQQHPRKDAADAEYSLEVDYDDSISVQLAEEMREMIEERVNHLLRKYWQHNGKDPQRLYAELWRCITDFYEDEDQVAALSLLLEDPRLRVPVHKALRMDQDEFEAAIDELGEDLLELATVTLVTPWQQKTERASMMLDLLDSVEGRELRTVLLARMMAQQEKIIREAMLMGQALKKVMPRSAFDRDDDAEDVYEALFGSKAKAHYH